MIHMKTNKGKTVKAQTGKKQKKRKDYKTPAEKNCFNNKKGSTVI